MESFIADAIPFLEKAAYVLMAIVIGATIIAKITPSPKDDETVSKISAYILKLVKFLPTIGVNPSTKKLEDAYEKLKHEDSKPS